MLRGHLQLPADVVGHQLPEEFRIPVQEHIVIPYAAADKDLLHPRQGPQPPQKLRVFRVVRIQILTRLRGQAAPVFAAAVLLLPGTGGVAEVGGGAAHIVDVSLKLRVFRQDLRLPHHGLDAPGCHHPPLVEGQGAEVAPAEAAPVVGDREAHLLDGGHPLGIHGVHLPGEGQVIEPVQLLPGQRAGRRIGREIPPLAGLHHAAAPDGIVLVVLQLGGRGVLPLILPHPLVGGDSHRAVDTPVRLGCDVRRAPDIGDLPHGDFVGKPPGDLPGGRLPHAVHQQVRRGVKEDGAAHLVVPVIVVGKASQGRLQPADDDGHITAEGLPGPVGIHDGGPVGAAAHPAPGGVQIPLPPPPGHGVVGHHAVQVPPADEHPEPGSAHGGECLGAVPVRLCQHRHPVALRLQQPCDEGAAEAGVVHIGVRHHHQKIVVIPLLPEHLLPAHREKFRSSHASSPYPM